MASKFHWLRSVADHAELTDGILPGQTVVEVIGEGRVLVEGHNGVLEYNDCEVSTKVGYGVVKTIGCNLKLTVLDKDKLVVTGEVHRIELLRRTKA